MKPPRAGFSPVRALKRSSLLLLALGLAACGEEPAAPNGAAIDAHLNAIIATEEATKANEVAESRAREDVREEEMENRVENYARE